MHASLPDHDIILLGLGHTNAHVLRMWRMQPRPRTRLTCVSNHPIATYSGMLPGVLSGQYAPEQMEIDLVRLCAAAGARLVIAETTGIDLQRNTLCSHDRPALPFDALSIGIGSIPTTDGARLEDDAPVVTIKPMQTFLPRLRARLESLGVRSAIHIVIVGGGAGGVETAFCLPRYVRRLLSREVSIHLTLISASLLLSSASAAMRHRVLRDLTERSARVIESHRVTDVETAGVRLDDGTELQADLVVWATGATAPPLLASLGLPVDKDGFLLTDDTLRSVSGAPVFAVGDSGTIAGRRLAKAGVYAVREAPVLWDNLRHVLDGHYLRRYKPQHRFLTLLNTGDGRAIGEWHGRSFEGEWCWRLKDRIDRRFVAKYQDYSPMSMTGSDAEHTTAMRCLGCGGKVGGSILARALARLDVPPHHDVVIGLGQPDDAAVLRVPDGGHLTVTTDFFAAPFDDPYVIGRLAVLNAASDLFATGASPSAALAMMTLPVGTPRQQEELLVQVLAGSVAELRTMQAALVGGHTIEGPQLTVGFTMLGAQVSEPPRRKGPLRPADHLVLTKPLGTGVLLAAHMRARCRAEWFVQMQAAMLQSNGPAAALLEHFDVSALTDVTGFGLASHLLEMVNASDATVELWLGSVPLLPGVVELIDEGIESTLAPANREAELAMEVADGRTSAGYQALFDPQTGGGLLFAVSPERSADAVAALRAAGYAQTSTVGRVVQDDAVGPRIRVSGRHVPRR